MASARNGNNSHAKAERNAVESGSGRRSLRSPSPAPRHLGAGGRREDYDDKRSTESRPRPYLYRRYRPHGTFQAEAEYLFELNGSVMQTVRELERETQELKQDNEEFKAETRALQICNRELAEEKEKLKKEKGDLQTQLASSQVKIDQLKNRDQFLTSQVQFIQKQLALAQSGKQNAEAYINTLVQSQSGLVFSPVFSSPASAPHYSREPSPLNPPPAAQQQRQQQPLHTQAASSSQQTALLAAASRLLPPPLQLPRRDSPSIVIKSEYPAPS